MSPYLPGPIPWLDDDADPDPAAEPAETLYVHDGAVCWTLVEDTD